MKKKTSITDIENYISFLEKRINSKNYKSNVSDKEFQETKKKLEKEKLKLKLLK